MEDSPISGMGRWPSVRKANGLHGFAEIAFVIDVFSRRIVVWRAGTSLRSDLPLDAFEQAVHDRVVDGPLIFTS